MNGAPAVDIGLAEIGRLEDVIDRQALGDVCRSFFGLFGISLRVFSRDGTLLADVHEEQHICRYVNGLPQGRRACASTVGAVKNLDATSAPVLHPCFTGALYRVVPIEYHGRTLGRFVLGPYLPAELKEVPRSLVVVDPGVDANAARAALTEMPRVRVETAERIATHLRGVIDLILFTSHRAALTSEMHLASVRESYRELASKSAQLQAAFDKLKELDRLKSTFLATVSHELRTPLTSIIGYSEMLAAGISGDLNAEQREFVDTIRSKGDHLLALISSLLDLGKLEQGNLALRREKLDPAGVADDIVRTVLPQAQKKGVVVRSSVEDGVRAVFADSVRIRQVLINITDNALKFTPKGGSVTIGVRPVIEERAAEGPGAVLMGGIRRAVEFSVSDTGIGIPAAEVPKIFDAFYQVDGSSTREHGGAGLGLSIVKRLVDAHDGAIRVESEPGRGTTVRVTFPELDGDGP